MTTEQREPEETIDQLNAKIDCIMAQRDEYFLRLKRAMESSEETLREMRRDWDAVLNHRLSGDNGVHAQRDAMMIEALRIMSLKGSLESGEFAVAKQILAAGEAAKTEA